MCHTNSFSLLARCPCVARNIKMHLYEKFILWEKRMNEGMPYLQMRRGVWVSFCKIAIFSFLSVGYKSDGLYCRMAATLTYLYSYKKTELVMMVFLPSCNIGHLIYIRRTGRKLWQFCKKIPTPLSAFANKAFPRSSFSPTR